MEFNDSSIKKIIKFYLCYQRSHSLLSDTLLSSFGITFDIAGMSPLSVDNLLEVILEIMGIPEDKISETNGLEYEFCRDFIYEEIFSCEEKDLTPKKIDKTVDRIFDLLANCNKAVL